MGDCLFDSISFALSASDIDVSASELRQFVARKAVHPAFAETRAFWASMLDTDLKEQFSFAKPILSNDMDKLYANMLDANLYWGEDFALQRLADRYSCRFLVLGKRCSASVTHPTRPRHASTLVLLYLANSHYEPLELANSFVQLI